MPRTVQLPENIEMPHYQYTDDQHITVQSDKEAIRFQNAPLCRQWLVHAKNKTINVNQDISKLIPDVFIAIGLKLIKLGEKNKEVLLSATSSEIKNDIT